MRHRELQFGALNRLPEADVHLVFKIAARFLLEFGFAASAATKHRGENVLESAATAGTPACCPGSVGEVAEVEAAEVERNPLPSCLRAAFGRTATSACVGLRRCGIDVVRVEAELVVDLALFRIAKNVVGFGERFELLLCGLVAGVHVRMVLARKFAEGLADLLRRSRLLHSENRVIVFLVGGGHFAFLMWRVPPGGEGLLLLQL